MPIKITITREEVQRLYNTGNFTMEKLAQHFGCTRSAIWYHIHPKKQPSNTIAHPVDVTCDGCGRTFKRKRGKGRPGKFFYCGSPCVKPAASKEVWAELAKEILE